MAHFAKINENNEVLSVLTVNDSDVVNSEGVETESVGQQYLETHNNWPAHLWIQTSYNTSSNKYYNQDNTEEDQSKAFRGNYAGVGFTWDAVNQIFWSNKPFVSWVKDIPSASWKSPLGNNPNISSEQAAQNTAGTHMWRYNWNETAYQADNTTGWELTDELA